MLPAQTLYLWGAVTVTQRDMLVAAMSLQAEVHSGYGYEPTGELAGSIRFSSVPGCAVDSIKSFVRRRMFLRCQPGQFGQLWSVMLMDSSHHLHSAFSIIVQADSHHL